MHIPQSRTPRTRARSMTRVARPTEPASDALIPLGSSHLSRTKPVRPGTEPLPPTGASRTLGRPRPVRSCVLATLGLFISLAVAAPTLAVQNGPSEPLEPVVAEASNEAE